MSSNKTVIPGMEDAYTEHSNFGQQNLNGQSDTCVPNPFGTNVSGTERPSQKPIIGFLYSISRSGHGEFWPLRIGSNSIGRADKNSICLSEATVSEEHAVLVVQQMKNPEKVIAWINDSGSTCGTMINGESLGFDRRECVNGDIITIGEHYDLYLILIDAKQIGLNIHRDFIPTQGQVQESQQSSNPYVAPSQNRFTQGYDQNVSNPQGGTVGIDDVGNKPVNKPGGTIFM